MYGWRIAWMIVVLFDCWFQCLIACLLHWLFDVWQVYKAWAKWSWGCCSEAAKRWRRLDGEGADSLFDVMLCFRCCVIVVVWVLLCAVALWGDERAGGISRMPFYSAEEDEQDLLLCWIEVGVVLCFACCFALFVCLFAILLVWRYCFCSFFVRLLRLLVGLLVSMLVSGQLFAHNSLLFCWECCMGLLVLSFWFVLFCLLAQFVFHN